MKFTLGLILGILICGAAVWYLGSNRPAHEETAQAGNSLKNVPTEKIQELVSARYSRDEWNSKF